MAAAKSRARAFGSPRTPPSTSRLQEISARLPCHGIDPHETFHHTSDQKILLALHQDPRTPPRASLHRMQFRPAALQFAALRLAAPWTGLWLLALSIRSLREYTTQLGVRVCCHKLRPARHRRMATSDRSPSCCRSVLQNSLAPATGIQRQPSPVSTASRRLCSDPEDSDRFLSLLERRRRPCSDP